MSDVCYAVRHDTLYVYDRDVAHAHQQLHLTPRDSERQRCLSHHIDVTPAPSGRSEYQDAFGNTVTRVELDTPHQRLEVVAEMSVRITPLPALDMESGDSWEKVRDQLRYNAQSRGVPWLEAMRFRGESPYVHIKRVLGEFARECLVPRSSVLSVADGVMRKIHSEFRYQPGATEIATPLMEVFVSRRGVCQDFAHLMIASLRSAGLAARYVSGYLHTNREPEPAKATAAAPGEAQEPATDMVGADASHAWVEVFAPPHGWIGFDPTNNLIVDQGHVALAWGRDFGDVSPLRGVILGGGAHQLSVKVAVEKTSPCA
jgi:transglutaminase-like putative cysteine protease